MVFFSIFVGTSVCVAQGVMPQLDSRCALLHCSAQVTAALCVCVRACVCASHRRASLATATGFLAERERARERALEEWREERVNGDRGERGIQAQIKPWEPGLGRAPLCYKYAGRLEVRVWWLGFETNSHHCCSSLPQGTLSLRIQDASRGRGPQAGLQGCPLQTQEEQPEESL